MELLLIGAVAALLFAASGAGRKDEGSSGEGCEKSVSYGSEGAATKLPPGYTVSDPNRNGWVEILVDGKGTGIKVDDGNPNIPSLAWSHSESAKADAAKDNARWERE